MFARHSLVWLADAGWQRALAQVPPACRAQVEQWRTHDWPTVARRADADAAADEVCVGIALPPDPDSGSKTRIPLRVPAADVRRVQPALDLDAAAAALPAALRPHFGRLAADADQNRLPFRVFGSVALEALTGQSYVTPASDIDLLLHPQTHGELQRGLALLDAHAAALPLDGEIVFPSGDAVAWKELLHALRAPSDPRVLAKGADTVRLLPTQTLLATLQEA